MQPLSTAAKPCMSRRAFGASAAMALLSGVALPAPAPRPQTGFGRAKSCILVYLLGGPPHQDMWDLKPDAPAEVRGPFQPIATSVPGVRICEHLPQLSRQADR